MSRLWPLGVLNYGGVLWSLASTICSTYFDDLLYRAYVLLRLKFCRLELSEFCELDLYWAFGLDSLLSSTCGFAYFLSETSLIENESWRIACLSAIVSWQTIFGNKEIFCWPISDLWCRFCFKALSSMRSVSLLKGRMLFLERAEPACSPVAILRGFNEGLCLVYFELCKSSPTNPNLAKLIADIFMRLLWSLQRISL